MDAAGNLWLADASNQRVRKINVSSPCLPLPAVSVNNAGNYSVIITSPSGSVTSLVATVTVLLPPSLLTPPGSQSAGLGSNATFTVTTAGTSPLSYQWEINGVMLSLQTNAALNLTNVQWSDAGDYQVVVTNDYGSVTSAVAVLTVGAPPALLSQPTNQVVLSGGNGGLSVAVVGDGPFTYQWQCDGTNLPPIITTVAGNGTSSYSGDGGAATNASLNYPLGVTVDALGNLLISDCNNYRIRKVDTNGIITTVAGCGYLEESGNGGPATNAGLYYIRWVTSDAAGNFYFSEFNGGRVRKVDANGIITVFAGGGGTLGEGIVATNASINDAQAVAMDPSGNLYIADYYWYRIRKVGTNGLMTTAAGNPSATETGGFSGDGGVATNAAMGTPYGVAVDSLGSFYITDNNNDRIRKVATNGIITTVIGGGSSSSDGILGTNTLLASPVAAAVDHDDNLYVITEDRIRKMDANGVMTSVAGGGGNYPGDYGPATSASLRNPMGLAFDAMNNLYIAEAAGRIRKVHFSGDPTLNLVNVAVTSTGNYSVLISSPFGSITSSVATLTVAVPPNIQTFSVTNGQFNLTWNAVSNLTYQLQYTVDLSGTNWISLGNPLTATNGLLTASDIPGGDSQRFYRVLLCP